MRLDTLSYVWAVLKTARPLPAAAVRILRLDSGR